MPSEPIDYAPGGGVFSRLRRGVNAARKFYGEEGEIPSWLGLAAGAGDQIARNVEGLQAAYNALVSGNFPSSKERAEAQARIADEQGQERNRWLYNLDPEHFTQMWREELAKPIQRPLDKLSREQFIRSLPPEALAQLGIEGR
jgi:hypothetical protein